MDAGLVRLPPGPERNRGRSGKERPAFEVAIGRFQGSNQPVEALVVPLEETVVVREWPGHLDCLPDRLGAAFGDVRPGPTMDVSHVAHQVAHLPFGTGWDGDAESCP